MSWGYFFGYVVDTSLLLDKDCIFSCGTIVTSLVTVSLPFSCNCKQGLIVTNEILPAAKWYWMLFEFLCTGRCWALLVLLGVFHFSTPSNRWCIECPFCLSLTCKKLVLLLSQNIFEDSFVRESRGDLKEKVTFSCKCLLYMKLHLFPRKMCLQVSSEWSVCGLQLSATDVPTIHFFHIHPLPRQQQALV